MRRIGIVCVVWSAGCVEAGGVWFDQLVDVLGEPVTLEQTALRTDALVVLSLPGDVDPDRISLVSDAPEVVRPADSNDFEPDGDGPFHTLSPDPEGARTWVGLFAGTEGTADLAFVDDFTGETIDRVTLEVHSVVRTELVPSGPWDLLQTLPPRVLAGSAYAFDTMAFDAEGGLLIGASPENNGRVNFEAREAGAYLVEGDLVEVVDAADLIDVTLERVWTTPGVEGVLALGHDAYGPVLGLPARWTDEEAHGDAYFWAQDEEAATVELTATFQGHTVTAWVPSGGLGKVSMSTQPTGCNSAGVGVIASAWLPVWLLSRRRRSIG